MIACTAKGILVMIGDGVRYAVIVFASIVASANHLTVSLQNRHCLT